MVKNYRLDEILLSDLPEGKLKFSGAAKVPPPDFTLSPEIHEYLDGLPAGTYSEKVGHGSQ
jgi:hypothetical protein